MAAVNSGIIRAFTALPERDEVVLIIIERAPPAFESRRVSLHAKRALREIALTAGRYILTFTPVWSRSWVDGVAARGSLRR